MEAAVVASHIQHIARRKKHIFFDANIHLHNENSLIDASSYRKKSTFTKVM